MGRCSSLVSRPLACDGSQHSLHQFTGAGTAGQSRARQASEARFTRRDVSLNRRRPARPSSAAVVVTPTGDVIRNKGDLGVAQLQLVSGLHRANSYTKIVHPSQFSRCHSAGALGRLPTETQTEGRGICAGSSKESAEHCIDLYLERPPQKEKPQRPSKEQQAQSLIADSCGNGADDVSSTAPTYDQPTAPPPGAKGRTDKDTVGLKRECAVPGLSKARSSVALPPLAPKTRTKREPMIYIDCTTEVPASLFKTMLGLAEEPIAPPLKAAKQTLHKWQKPFAVRKTGCDDPWRNWSDSRIGYR